MLYKNGTFSYLRQSRTFVYAGNQNLVFEHAQSSYDTLVAKYILKVYIKRIVCQLIFAHKFQVIGSF